jgi:hypothetical protein
MSIVKCRSPDPFAMKSLWPGCLTSPSRSATLELGRQACGSLIRADLRFNNGEDWSLLQVADSVSAPYSPAAWLLIDRRDVMAKKTIRVSDMSGEEIADGKGATIRITFADARKGVRELDVTDAEADKLGGRSVARRGRKPRTAAA